MRRRNWSKKDQSSQKRTQAQHRKLLRTFDYLMVNDHNFYQSIDAYVPVSNELDDSWE